MAGRGNNRKGRKGPIPALIVPSPEETDSVSCLVDKSKLDTLFSTLNYLRSSLGMVPDKPRDDQPSVEQGEDGSPHDIRGVIADLISAVQTLTSNLGKISKIQDEQEKKIRNQDDELDELKQRSLKGNILVSSIPNKSKGKVSLLKTDDQLKSEGITMQAHIISLIKDKYGINLPESDIQACHRLPRGSVVLRIWNRKQGSVWEDLVRKIKSPENSEFNVFFNFQLTNRRSNLLYECRMLKKEGKIDKYFSDENGCLKLKVKAESKDKVKITYVSYSAKDIPVTLSKDELLGLISKET